MKIIKIKENSEVNFIESKVGSMLILGLHLINNFNIISDILLMKNIGLPVLINLGEKTYSADFHVGYYRTEAYMANFEFIIRKTT